MEWISLLAIFLSLLLIGFFAGIEIAFISSNKLSIELRKKQGTVSGRIWGAYNEQPAQFIGTLLVGLNLVLVVYGMLIGELLFPVWSWLKKHLNFSPDYVDYFRLLVETLLSTAIILFVEFMSKALFRARNNDIVSSNVLARVTHFFYGLFSGIARVFVQMAEWILKYVFNVKVNARKEAFSKIDLEHFLQQHRGLEQEETLDINQKLFEKALSLSEIRIRECLIPRKEIEGLESGASMDMVRQKFMDTQLSRILVYEQSIDNIIGYVHHLDLFKKPAQLRDILHPIPMVPESMSATDLMNKLSRERKSIAWVVDEFGGTSGIVTMEDLLEELFGEIEDEHDVPEVFVDRQIARNEFIFSGRLELDHITQKYGIRFEDNEGAETLSGYIIQKHAAIPRQKERIIIDDFEFDILNVSDTRIETVKLKILK